jgi:hypothetical protein
VENVIEADISGLEMVVQVFRAMWNLLGGFMTWSSDIESGSSDIESGGDST